MAEPEEPETEQGSAGLAVTPDGDMVIGGFRFTPTGMIPIGEPGFEDWDRVGVFLRYMHTGSQFWLGDWLNYGEGVYGERYSQALEHTGYELHTLETYAWVARAVPRSNRLEKVPFGHYANGIAALEESEQLAWAQRVVSENLSQSALRGLIRTAKRARVSADAQLPDGRFRVVYADNPWQYDDAGSIPTGPGKADAFTKAESHYPTMSIEQLVEFYGRLRGHLLEDAVLFAWVPAPLLFENPGPRDVFEAAGLTYKANRVWNKQAHHVGHYVSVQHEHLLIYTRGSCQPDRLTPMLNSVVSVKRSKTHSEKPEQFRKDIERLYDGPYLELFGRKPVEGWTVFGNDLALVEPRDVETES